MRSWKGQFVATQRIGLAGGLREDHSANHVYLMMLHRDLPDRLAANVDRGSITAPTDASDVVCLMKKFISSSDLAQRPLLLLPQGRTQRVAMVPTGKTHGSVFD